MAHLFTLAVSVGGIDISSRLRDAVEVEIEEGAARLASITFRPAPGALMPVSYVGAAVTIDHQTRDAGGAILSTTRVFTGIIDVPEWDWATRTLSCTCTDNRHNRLQAMTTGQIDALTPGALFSEAVSGEGHAGMSYAEERLASIASSLDISAGGAFRLTASAAKATPDFTLGDAELKGIPRLESASRHDIVNKIIIQGKFRFKRLWQRRLALAWTMTHHDASNWAGYLLDPYTRPSRQTILQAIEGTGWVLTAPVSWTPPPPSGLYGGISWGIDEGLRAQEAVAFTATVTKNFGQDIEEVHDIEVIAPSSITKLGESISKSSLSLDTDYDDSEWGTDSAPHVAPPAGFTQYGTEAWFKEEDTQGAKNRATFAAALEVAVARARVRLLANHRRNFVHVSSRELRADIDVVHTVEILTSQLVAQGKVYKIVHRWQLGEGAATTTDITLALSRLDASGVSEDSYTPATPSAGKPQDPPNTPMAMSTHIGGKTASPPHDDTWMGWVTNYVTQQMGANVYPQQFRCPAPAIDGDWRELGGAAATDSIAVNIPEDLLSITN